MAMTDYGAMVKVNGEFINKNKGLFMNMKNDLGFTIKTAKDQNNNSYKIDKNYFAYVGSEDFLLCFYKTYFHVIQNKKIVYSYCGNNFNSETRFIGDINIYTEHLEKEYLKDIIEIDYSSKEELSKNKWFKYIEYVRRQNKTLTRYNMYKTQRYLTTWKHNDNKYEVLFGYGIDTSESIWNDIKNKSYDFTKNEIKIIDKWFK